MTARFPAVPARRGHYESFYLRAADPASGRSAWIRHTVHKRPGEGATGALWCTVFDAAAHGGAWELGTREAAPGVLVQPYPDP